MSKILLAIPKLKDGWQDLSVGEPHLIRENLLQAVDINSCMPIVRGEDFSYGGPCGYDELVKYLEHKHGYPVVITNGAKQGLGAALYACKQMGALTLGVHRPYWALIPEMSTLHGLHLITYYDTSSADAVLMVSPNNPDGVMADLKKEEKYCAKHKQLMIHDAAYYTGIYMGPEHEQGVYGDVQVYSISKMLGLSSLRLGYCVCKNEEIYKRIQHYMEHMTVGVSKISQMFCMNILHNLDMKKFETKCFNDLENNREIVYSIREDILETKKFSGMFMWSKIKDKKAFERAGLYIIDGDSFGDPDYVRINIAFSKNKMQEIVDKLNAA